MSEALPIAGRGPVAADGPAAPLAAPGPRAVAADPSTADDPLLLTLARGGDRGAFGVLVARHHGAVWAVVRQRFGTAVPVEDVVQEVFVRALGAVDGFRGSASFLTWATAIALNLATDWVRRKHRRDRLAPAAEPDAHETAASRGPGPAELVQTWDEAARAARALDDLPHNIRIAVTLRVVEDVSYEEIARRMGVTAPRIRTWVSRGLKRLRVALGDEEVSRDPA